MAFGPPVLLLLWACYAHGAFLEPARTVAAATAPTLGLLWTMPHLLRRREQDGVSLGGRWGLHRGSFCGIAEALLLALAVLGAISAVWSLDWRSSLEAAGLLLGGFFYIRIGRELGRSPSARWAVLMLLSEVGVLLSLLSIAGYAFGISWFTQDLDGTILPTGTFGYANALAGFLFLSLACTAALFLESRGAVGRLSASGRCSRPVLFGTAAALQVATIGLTRSRAAVAIVILLSLWVLGARAVARLKAPAVRRWVVAGVVLLVAGGAVAAGVLLWSRLRPYLSSADVFRLKTWQAALEAARQSPILGHGLGTFYPAYAPFKAGAQTTYAHNIFVQNLVELGAVGTVLIAAFLATAVIHPVRAFVARVSSPQVALLLGLQAFVLQNLVDLTWYFPALLLAFGLLLGMMFSYRPDAEREPAG